MTEKQKKSKIIVYLTGLVLVLLVSLVLALLHRIWWFYPIGALVGIISHALMVIQSDRFLRIQKNDSERVTFHPKRDAILWVLLRILVNAVILVGIVFLALWIYGRDNLVEVLLITLGGYMTVKGVFIILLMLKEGR